MLVDGMLLIARKKLTIVASTAPLIDAAKILGHKEANLVVVCGAGGVLAGVISKTDVVRQIGACKGYSCTIAASAVMTRNVVFCRPQDFLGDVWETMKERGLKHIPVIDESERPVGLLIARDVLDALLAEVEYEEQLLRDYVMSVGYH